MSELKQYAMGTKHTLSIAVVYQGPVYCREPAFVRLASY